MLKNKVIIIIVSAIILLVLAITSIVNLLPQKAILEIEDIYIEKKEVSNPTEISSIAGNYEATFSEIEENAEHLKEVNVCFYIKNVGFKEIANSHVRFSKNQDLPSIILGKRMNKELTYVTSIPYKKDRHLTYKILVDASNNSDEEIIELLKNVDVCVIDNTKPYTMYDECTIISESIKLSSRQGEGSLSPISIHTGETHSYRQRDKRGRTFFVM